MTPPFFSSSEAFALILAMAAVTYSLRLGGLLLAQYLPQSGRWARALEALPGCVMVALILPSVVAAGWIGALAALLTAVMARLSGNLLISMSVGVAVIALSRYFWGT